MVQRVTYKIKKLGYGQYAVYRNGRMMRNFEYLDAAQRFVKGAREERKRALKLEKAYRAQYKKTGKVKRLPKSRVRRILGG